MVAGELMRVPAGQTKIRIEYRRNYGQDRQYRSV